MQFFKAFISTLLIASPMAFAAPRPDESGVVPSEVDNIIAELVNLTDGADVEARNLEARQGMTCNFLGGNKGCQLKCFAMGKGGGYCDNRQVCICH